uniref:All-trans-retinol 13,14-reductase n=1 Tax=Phallusia mammillata TaxID=59560 RepID=A0A6F9DQ09_9ASCI|nr:all-trans-retinol 13,14-reductase [Phallusia mammillata]
MYVAFGLFVVFLLLLFGKKFKYMVVSESKNPFKFHATRPYQSLQTDKKVRNATIKKGLRPELIPSNIDAIIIGSGMGGLTCAGMLARAGKRVLVLEQHGRIGGCTHTFKEKGFEYDIGIHYIGNMEAGSINRCLLDLLTDGNLKWISLCDDFDSVVIDKEGKTPRKFTITKGRQEQKNLLIKQFPDEKTSIDKYFAILKDCSAAASLYCVLKIFPLFIWKLFFMLKLHKIFFKRYAYLTQTSLKQVLDELTDNEELKCVLAYSFGDYGCVPSRAPFLMHGMLINHFARTGGYYPYGGASEIAFQMVPGIESAGGRVLARARVDQILFDDGKACGVKLATSTVCPGMEIKAPIVISDCGIYNTYQSLLPTNIKNQYGLFDDIQWVEKGLACFQIMVGLKGTSEDLDLEAKNYWIYTTEDVESEMKDYLNLSKEEAANAKIPLLFVSFPSAKDPSWNERYPGKSTCVIVTFSKTEWFDEWTGDDVKRRGLIYDNLKKTFINQAWDQVLNLFPHLKDKVEVISGGSPLSHMHYINSMHGEIYGVNHNKERFYMENAANLRPKTPIPGLYLCGQDVFTAGMIGSALGGVLAASEVLNRYLFLDLINNVRETRKQLIF